MTSSPNPRATSLGIACGMGAGALWGLVFLAPELVGDFGPLPLTIGRYLCYGLISALLIAPRWKALSPYLTRDIWRALVWLALAGNVIYYLLLSSAVQLGGIAMTSLVIGFLPVAVTIIGSRDAGAVPLRRLLLSLSLCAAGALCIGGQALTTAATGPTQWLGLICAIGALISWSAFAVGNSRWLKRLDHISAHDWNMLLGVMTGALSLLLIPIALFTENATHSPQAWAQLGAVSLGVALLASILGNALWNQMSRLLPLTLVGQMILFETVFALLYGFLWEQRWPTLLESAAFILVVASVLSCIAAHHTQNRPPQN